MVKKSRKKRRAGSLVATAGMESPQSDNTFIKKADAKPSGRPQVATTLIANPYVRSDLKRSLLIAGFIFGLLIGLYIVLY